MKTNPNRVPAKQTAAEVPQRGWRSVFGKAQPEDVGEVDAIIAEEFGHVAADEWRTLASSSGTDEPAP